MNIISNNHPIIIGIGYGYGNILCHKDFNLNIRDIIEKIA